MQKVIIFTIIILSIVLLIFSFTLSDEIEFFIKSQFNKYIGELEKNGFEVAFRIKDTGVTGIELGQVRIKKDGLIDGEFDRVKLSPDIWRMIRNLSYNIKVSFYNGKIDGKIPDIESTPEKGLSNISVYFYNVDLDIDDVIYKGTKNRFVISKSSGELFPYITSGKLFKLTSEDVSVIVRKTGKLLKGEIELKDQKVKKFENFFRDFSSIQFEDGLFDARMEFSFLNEEEHLDGKVVFRDAYIHFDGIPTALEDFSGSVFVEDDLRRFDNNTFKINGKMYTIDGFRKSGHSLDITVKDPKDQENYLRIFGPDSNIKMDGKLVLGDLEIKVLKERDIKIELSSDDIKGIVFLSLDNMSGNFRVNFNENINLWGDYRVDSESFSFFTDRSFIRVSEKTLPFRLSYTGKLFLEIDEFIELSLNPEKKQSQLIISLPFFKDRMEGLFDIKERKMTFSSEKGFLELYYKDTFQLKTDYSLDIEEIVIDSFKAQKIGASIKINRDEKLIKGNIKEFQIYDFTYEGLEYSLDLENFCLTAYSNEKSIEIKKVDGIYSGEIENINYIGNIREYPFSFDLKKAVLSQKEDKYILRPEKAKISFLSREMTYKSGEMNFSAGTMEIDDMTFVDGNDQLKVSFLKDAKSIDYDVNYIGNKELKINDLFTIYDKVIRVSGEDGNFHGTVLFDKAKINAFENMYAGGKLIIKNGDISLKDCVLKYNESTIDVKGKGKDFFNSYDLTLSTENDEPLTIKQPDFELQTRGTLELNIKKNGPDVKYGINGDIKEGRIKVFNIPADKKSVLPEYINLDFENVLFLYKGNSFNTEGSVDYSFEEDRNNVYIELVDGKIDIIGNNFKVVEGVLTSVDIKSNITEKEIRITGSSGKLDTEYKVSKKQSDVEMDEKTFESIGSLIWMDLLFSREVEDSLIFVSIKGSALDRNVYFYSDPPMTQDEMYEKLKSSSIFSVLEAESDRSKLMNFLGAEKKLLKRFTKGFNFDSVNLRSDDDGVDLRIKKDLNERVSLNYNKGLVETEDSFGLEYKFNRNLFFESENKEKENRLKLKWKIEF